MATFDEWITNSGNWIARLTVDVYDNSSGGYSDLTWNLYLLHQTLRIAQRTHYVWIDGTEYSCTSDSIRYSGLAVNTTHLGGGTHRIWHTDGRSVSVSAQISLNATIGGSYKGSYYPSGSVWIAQLAVNPSLPTWVSASGSSGTWVNKDDPRFNASWGGANPRNIYHWRIFCRCCKIWNKQLAKFRKCIYVKLGR